MKPLPRFSGIYSQFVEDALPQQKICYMDPILASQTRNDVNRDAASPMRGIIGFQNSENAARRWCITSTERGMAVTELRQPTGLRIEDIPATQLRPNRIRKDNEHINALMETLTEACDPFSAPASTTDNLLNLASGKATATATKYYLLQTLEQGETSDRGCTGHICTIDGCCIGKY